MPHAADKSRRCVLANRLDTLAIAAGVLAPLLYAATVILGAALTPGYSHVANAISELIASGAAAKPLLDPLFAVYNLLLIAFALGLRPAFRRLGVHLFWLSPWCLALVALAGLAMWPFPQDPIGTVTGGGIVHLILAGVQSLGTILAILFMAESLRRQAWRRFAVYCYATTAAILVSGVATAISVANAAPAFGLIERVTIGLFLQWMLVTAVTLADSGGKARLSATV